MSEHRRPLCRVDELEAEGALEVRLVGTPPTFLVVIARAGEVYAYLNVCPHAGRPMNWAPNQFLFTPEGHLVCAAHGATFDVEGGECLLGPCLGASLTRIPVAVEEGTVWAV